MQRRAHNYLHAASVVEEAGECACGRQEERENKHRRLNKVVDMVRLLQQIGGKQRQQEKVGEMGQTAAKGFIER